VLKLRVSTTNRVDVPLDVLDAGVHVWRDADSRVVAWGRNEGDKYWMCWPGLASFRFTAAGDELVAYPVPGARLDDIEDTFLRSVTPMALQALGREALHASGVLGPSGVVAFCARSQSGKSTLAYGLARRGWPQWADDAVVLDMGGDVPAALPLPFRVRLRPASARFYGGPTTPVPTAPRDAPAPLAAVFVLDRRQTTPERPPVRVERLGPSATFLALLTHAYCFNPDGEPRRATMVRHYADVAAAVPVFRLAFHDDLDRLPELLDSVNTLVERSMHEPW
jgi:hypothetical protein